MGILNDLIRFPLIFYSSPSGIQLKTMDEIRSYLIKEGTCKCGLECPMHVEKVFDFDDKVLDLTA